MCFVEHWWKVKLDEYSVVFRYLRAKLKINSYNMITRMILEENSSQLVMNSLSYGGANVSFNFV